MARIAKEKSDLEKKGQAARDALAKTKEQDEKSPSAATKKAVAEATERAKAATKAENRERFEIIAGGRVGSVITKIRALAKCANRRAYEFSEADIKEMIPVLAAELKALDETFNSALHSSNKTKEAAPAFKFGSTHK